MEEGTPERYGRPQEVASAMAFVALSFPKTSSGAENEKIGQRRKSLCDKEYGVFGRHSCKN